MIFTVSELILILVITIGTTITLYIHTDSKLQEYNQRSLDMIESIRQDIRDFHGRLCIIEERNKK